MVGLSGEQQFKLRAHKALETGNRFFKPRGAANKATFAKMKEEFDNQAAQIMSHTTTEADRIIEETASRVLETIGRHTQVLPEQIDMATKLAGPSTTVGVLNSIITNEGMECKGTKAEKAAALAREVPVHKLVSLLAEHGGSKAVPTGSAKGQAKAKPSPLQDSDCGNTSDDDTPMTEDRDAYPPNTTPGALPQQNVDVPMPPRMRKRVRATSDDASCASRAPPLAPFEPVGEAVIKDIEDCYYPKLLPTDLCARVEKFLLTVKPAIIKFGNYKTALKSRPKYAWGIPNADDEYPLYYFGQAKEAYSLMERMPDILHEVAHVLEDRFGHARGFLNLAMATYYWNGKDHHIVPHQDKAVSKECNSRVEDCAPIYNISLGAVRPFKIAAVDLISVWDQSKGNVDIGPYVLKSIPMYPGDLVRLSPLMNKTTAHMVPKDASITDLRISLVFRHCDNRWVKLNQYHYNMKLRGRRNQKRWTKVGSAPLSNGTADWNFAVMRRQ